MTACPLEDRLALEDLVLAYAHAVDSLSDIDGILACFTEDADYDLTGIGMAHVTGHAGIRESFEGVFAANSHHAHYITNFAVTAYSGDAATTRNYVIGMGRGYDGSSILVHGRYHFEAVRTPAGWRFARYTMAFLMPPG